ncbi:MAG: hypothetical protein ACHQ5A_07270 [Opitutales bacterium]
MRIVLWMAVLLFGPTVLPAGELMLGSHPARYAPDGSLLPWTSWTDALGHEMAWYQRCPAEHGYPRFVTMTFMDGDYQAIASRKDFIPAMQNGMGILSYLKYHRFTGLTHPEYLRTARLMGDYLIHEACTPAVGKYPGFPRSTGQRDKFPQPPDCGSQDDKPYEIQPDKGGLVGFALFKLYDETRDESYLQVARSIARVLATNQHPGDATHSPWPFRADFRTGAARGAVSGNMSYILRLYDAFLARGEKEFAAPRAALWQWITQYQLPSAAGDGRLWVEFFEDHHNQNNRTAWAPLALAAYLTEERGQLSPTWQAEAKTLIEFVNRNFVRVRFGVAVCGEQDEDPDPWGGINSTYGAVLASYSAATGSPEYRRIAEQALTFSLYGIDEDGCPRDLLLNRARGGWQEDAHTDKVHNFVDALTAFPEWGR